MADIVIDFPAFKAPNRIGLIVRGKQGPNHHPDKLAQHVDVVLADGSPEGFFGEGNDGAFNSAGLGIQGVVYDCGQQKIHRPSLIRPSTAE